MGEGERDILKRPPRDPIEPILGRVQWLAVVLYGVALTATTFGALALGRFWLLLDQRATVTVTFLTLAFAQLWHVFNIRHRTSGLFDNEITGNSMDLGRADVLRQILVTAAYVPRSFAYMLHMVAPDIKMSGIVLCMSLAPLLIGLIVRSFVGRYVDRKNRRTTDAAV